MNTEQILIEKFGPLLTISQLAVVLNRSADGLRFMLSRSDSDIAGELGKARRKIGRRVYFKAADVAKVIDGVE